MSATSCAVPLIMLCTEAICLLSVSIKALYAIVFERFWSQENSFARNTRKIILAKFAPQSLEKRKILSLDPA